MNSATQNLKSLTMTKLRTLETHRGIAWTGTLCIDNKPVMSAECRGDGGCMWYRPLGGQTRAFVREIEAAACEATGMAGEALDLILAHMGNGDRADKYIATVAQMMA